MPKHSNIQIFKYSNSVNQLLKKCEAKSGFACDISYDETLATDSTVKMAGRDGRLRHQIILKQHNADADYYVAWQAVFILRQFSTDAENRANISQNPEGFESTKAELGKLHPSMQGAELDNFANHILGGIITQLRSVPIGILVDIYLFREFEELRETQEKVLTQQVHQYWPALNIDKSQFPETIILANQHMNAAHAAMVDYQYPSPELTAPYKMAGMEAISLQLLDACLNRNDDDMQDKAIIDDWGKLLNIQNLYRWV